MNKIDKDNPTPRRINVTITDEQYEFLCYESAARSISMSERIRQLIEQAIDQL